MTTTPPLHVTVFGATGGIGHHVVELLLAAGHTVTAYARNPSKLQENHQNLRVVEGDLDDAAAIGAAVNDADAVISALGPSLKRNTTGTPVTDGTRTIVKAMEASGVRRYIGLATPAVTDPRDRPTLRGKALGIMPRIAMPNAFQEITGMTDAVTNTDLDWTIARITNPTDKPSKGTIRAGFLGRDKVGWAMTRADIATFLVDQLDDDTYRQALPAISN